MVCLAKYCCFAYSQSTIKLQANSTLLYQIPLYHNNFKFRVIDNFILAKHIIYFFVIYYASCTNSCLCLQKLGDGNFQSRNTMSNIIDFKLT